MNILKQYPLILQENFEQDFSNQNVEMVNFVISNRVIPESKWQYSFTLPQNEYFDSLYNVFLKTVKSIFKKFTITERRPAAAYVSDELYHRGDWHDHLDSSTINAVFYLQTNKNEKGILFKDDYMNEFKIIPKKYDMLIFPNYAVHYPIPFTHKEKRISINMELKCKETAREIFDINNLNTEK